MTRRLGLSTFFTESYLVSDSEFEKIRGIDEEMIVYPEVTMEVLEQYDAAPQPDEDLDEDADDLFEVAKERFEDSDAFYEWKDGFVPVSMYLHPCDPFCGDQELANRLNDLGVAVTYVNGSGSGSSYQGFMLTGGGMDLSDHLAMAYVSADCMPPQHLLQRAVTNTHNDAWREILLDALEDAKAYLVREIESYDETIAKYRETAPSLT